MKKSVLAFTACGLLLLMACQKHDHLPKKLCQLTSVERVFPAGIAPYRTGKLTYSYNADRLLTRIVHSFAGNPLLDLLIEYNNRKMPIAYREQLFGANDKLIYYSNGRISRLDNLYNNTDTVPEFSFIYDHLGRLIERKGTNWNLYWEYEGFSRNPKRKLWGNRSTTKQMAGNRQTGSLDGIFQYSDYQYDNKINPERGFINFDLTPLNFGDPYFFFILEPITDNNVVREDVYGKGSGDSTFRKGQEFHMTYQYNDVYPVKANVTHYRFSTNPPEVLTGYVLYTYDCKER